MTQLIVNQPTDLRKPYSKPEIIHELDLETRAGSTLPGFVDPLDPASGLQE